MALAGDSGPERADLQIAVRISRSGDITPAELLLSARRQGFVCTEGLPVRAAIARLPAEFDPELAVCMEQSLPEKGR